MRNKLVGVLRETKTDYYKKGKIMWKHLQDIIGNKKSESPYQNLNSKANFYKIIVVI